MNKIKVFILISLSILLTACNSPSKVVDDYDTSKLSTDFGGNEAYEIGANAKGMPIFRDVNEAFKQAQIDFKQGFEAISKEYELDPVNQTNYQDYKTYGWQLETKDETVKQQGIMITKFFDIYENSFDD